MPFHLPAQTPVKLYTGDGCWVDWVLPTAVWVTEHSFYVGEQRELVLCRLEGEEREMLVDRKFIATHVRGE